MENILILILSILGISITSYLTIAHVLKKKVICPINSESCNIVLNSKYSKTLGVKTEIIGLLYYIGIIIALFIVPSPGIILATKLASMLAAVYSLVLLVIQVRIIKNYCSWCIISGIINILLSLLIVRL